MINETEELDVENPSFMLDRFGEDCGPLQFLRELTENAAQAIEVTGEPGEVVWDVDWVGFEADGLQKLCCVDTGVGMDADELQRYIRRLSSSRHEQRLDGNFGVGAKVAIAAGNPAGVIYVSWKHGQGSMVQLWRDQATGKWGLRRFHQPDGSWVSCLPVEDSIKPERLRGREHGTVVVLVGDSERANTMEPPEGVENQKRWISKYLNQRYFRFPAGVRVRAREDWDPQTTVNRRGTLREVRGQADYLQASSIAQGEVPLSDAVAHWWILDEHHERRSRDSVWASTGHRAALFQDELYDLVPPSRGGYQKVQEFGARFSYSRVVIYVEPAGALATFARSDLRVNREPLPWARWAEEFAALMPEEIRALEEQMAPAASHEEIDKTVRQRLDPLRQLYKQHAYRPQPAGELELGPPETGGTPAKLGRERSGNAGSGTTGGVDGNVYALFQAEHGLPGEEAHTEFWPRVDWVSERHTPPTRVSPHLEDRAAHYDRRANRLEINEDFRVFRSALDRWTEAYAHVPGSSRVVEQHVKAWYAMTLTEVVLGAQGLRGSRLWNEAAIDSLLSEEALTAAVQPRFFIEGRLKKDLAQALGQKAELPKAA